jgi:tyrosyl-tRNA synthetase
MFGKIMSIPDSLITKYMRLCTNISFFEIEETEKNLENKSINPKNAKIKLALNIVINYHGEVKAKQAEQNWENIFSKKEIPNEIEEINCEKEEILSETLVKNKILSSKGEWRRLVEGNAIHNLIENKNITDFNFKVNGNLTLKIGKKRFVKIIVK